MFFVYNKNMKTKTISKNIPIFASVLVLLVLGCINTYGASFTSEVFSNLYIKQIISTVLAVLIFLVLLRVNNNFIFKNSSIFYIIGIFFLIGVLIFGVKLNGAMSWFKIGGISIQPSELFKPIYLTYLSILFWSNKTKLYYLKLALVTLIPIILIFIEPDSGVAFMYLIMALGVFLGKKIDKRIIIGMLITIVLILSLCIFLYKYKKNTLLSIVPTSFHYRINRLLKEDEYQATNAIIGIGSSGLKGHGLKDVKVYVPEMISDFAFALLIMNFGYPVGIIIVLIYTYILFFIYKKSIIYKGINSSILKGTFFLMIFQCVEHIFMNLGITPITGITLPFLSYGGSSLLSYSVLLSLIIKITTNNSSYN